MNNTLTLVAYMAIVTWLMLMVASLMRAHAWTLPGLMSALGNREKMPDASPLAARTDRAARNTLENFVLFAAIVLAARASGANGAQVELGAQIFFIARLVYIPIYMAGIPYLRTAAYVVSLAGLGMILKTIIQY
jgi:uncharacterized MAPEG superfamily protein